MDELEVELKIGFLDEASQGIEEVEQCFLALESNPSDMQLIDKIFRLAHNLKGSSKAVGFNQLGDFTHIFENFLLKIKKQEIEVSSNVVSLLLKCNDHLKLFIEQLKADLSANVDSSLLSGELEQAINHPEQNISEEKTSVITDDQPQPPSVDIEMEYHETIGIPKQELVPNSAAFEEADPIENLVTPPPSSQAPHPSKKDNSVMDESVRVSLSKLDMLINFVGEMVILQNVLKEQALQTRSDLLRKSVHQLGRVSKEIQDLSMGLRMLPIKPISQKLQRIVRDTSNALGKKIDFVVEGEDTAVDKTVLDQIGDPLVHIVRNAADHGIETAEKRALAKKTSHGNIRFRSFHKGDKLIIEVQDDGGGIDHTVLEKKAIEKGIINADHKLTQQDLIHLVFHPGFSTKSQTTEISGRGVGMDVVKTNIEALQGTVEIETEIGTGSTFRIILPLTLAIIDGLILESSKDYYIVPLSQIRDSLKPQKEQVQWNKDLGETLVLRGENIPLYRLDSLIKKAPTLKNIQEAIVVIIKGSQGDFGLVVDDILSQQQVVIKKLGLELQHIKGFSGSAILGSGKPALILEPQDLVQFSNKHSTLDFSQRETA